MPLTNASELTTEQIAAALIHNDHERELVEELLRRLAREERDCIRLIDERDSREAVINDLCGAAGHALGFDFEWTSHYGFTEAVRDVGAKVDALREDKARLDWLTTSGAMVSRMSSGRFNVWLQGKGDFEADTLRGAIDLARVYRG